MTLILQDIIEEYCNEHNCHPEDISTRPDIEIELICIREDNFMGELEYVVENEVDKMQISIEGGW